MPGPDDLGNGALPDPDDDDDEVVGLPPGAPFPFSGRRRRLPEEGDLEVFVGDEQDAEPVDGLRWQGLAEQVLVHEGISGDAELSVLFVDEATMAELNNRFMGADGPTDVLAFPLEDELVEPGRFPDSGTTGPVDPRIRGEGPEPPLLLGDVVVCPAVAARNAVEHGRSYTDEMALLVVHGILHVLGHDHADAEEEAAMQAKERDLLTRFHGAA
ncbi:MAG: rRNA maturation RNase YbeY [Actinomycetota bacterium]|nr:rRNA maturation RNase YbeY [Acidimicrobiia bacterium]MDQ3293288.1 rRNA maturation RNase YbeY [Actinomycetota bacterium]